MKITHLKQNGFQVSSILRNVYHKIVKYWQEQGTIVFWALNTLHNTLRVAEIPTHFTMSEVYR